MSEIYDSVDYNNINFEYIGPTNDVSFNEYMNSKELFNAIKNNQIKFSEARIKQNQFLNKLDNIKIGKKSLEQKEVINNLEKFYNSREEVFNFLEVMLKCYQMQITMREIIKLKEKDLKYYQLNKCLKDYQ